MNKIIALLCIVVLAGCKKDDNSPSYKSPSQGYVDNPQITERDVNGNLFGSIDLSDWNTNENFSSAFQQHFNFPDTLDYSNADTSTTRIICFPNYYERFLTLAIENSAPSVMKMVMVDASDAEICKYSFNVPNGGSMFYFDFGDTLIHKDQLYRIFYQFYDAPNHSFARGHGDILKHF